MPKGRVPPESSVGIQAPDQEAKNGDQVGEVNHSKPLKGIPVKTGMVAGKLNMRMIKDLGRRKGSKPLLRKASASNGFQDPSSLAKIGSKASMGKESSVPSPRGSGSISPNFTWEIGIQSGFVWPTSKETCEGGVVESAVIGEEARVRVK